jgi:hypothetical protein
MFARVVADIAAEPHGADHVGEGASGHCAEAVSDMRAETVARKNRSAITIVEMREHRVLCDECERIDHRNETPNADDPNDANLLVRDRRHHHDPESEIKPQWVAPHRDKAASARECPEDQHCRRPKREQRNDAPVKGIGLNGGHSPRRLVGRIKERKRDEQRWDQPSQLRRREHERRERMATKKRGPGLSVSEWQEIVLNQPNEVRGGDEEHNPGRDVGARCCQRSAGLGIETDEDNKGQRQHDHKVFRPHRAAERETEHGPMRQAPVAQSRVKGETRQRPERKLRHIMIELGRGEAKEVETVNNEHRYKCAALANQPSSAGPDRGESRKHGHL